MALGRKGDQSNAAAAREAARLVVDYAKQETLGPMKGLARFAGFGVAGSVVLAGGLVLLLVALLRVLQDETGSVFTGHLSWLPYLCTAAVAVTVLALAAWRIVQGPARKAADESKGGRGR